MSNTVILIEGKKNLINMPKKRHNKRRQRTNTIIQQTNSPKINRTDNQKN
jgi:hypothetical protein